MAASNLTAERLRELLHYEPDTGIFRWRQRRRGSGASVGAVAGWANDGGFGKKYCRMVVDGRHYYAHRLARLYVHGAWPRANIDHRDGDSDRIENLRDAEQQQNTRNAAKRVDNTTGFKGVLFRDRRKENRSPKWIAIVIVNGKRKQVGSCDSAVAAAAAYDEAAIRVYGEFAKTNEMLGLL